MTTITIVTPWLNHRELERDYWLAVRQVDADVLVVDNGSVPPLPNGWRLPENAGFARACNEGLRLARTDAVLFLNNDIAATEQGDWLAPIRAALEPGVLVGADLRSAPHGDVDGETLPYLDGWCLAGMTADLRDLGGFDEAFAEPSYYGDNDLSFRARLAGMTLREAPVTLMHKRNVTAGPGSDPRVAAVSEMNYRRFADSVRAALLTL